MPRPSTGGRPSGVRRGSAPVPWPACGSWSGWSRNRHPSLPPRLHSFPAEKRPRKHLMPIRAVFFDLDDTLCNTIGTREARARRAFEALRRERPNLDGDAFVSRVMEPAGPLLVRGVPAVVNELGLALTPGGRDALALWDFVGW